jgi:RNA polymerase sigma-70 factor (ECF subfamily)
MGVETSLGEQLERVWRQRGGEPPSAETVLRLRELVLRGAEAWPELAPDLEAMERFIAERTTGPEDLDPARGSDWMLASECARGEPRAIAAFEARLMPQIVGAVRRLKLGPGELDLALQRVRTDILVSAPDRPAGITRYAGRGELSAWLRVSAVRAAMKLSRGRGRESSFEEDQLGERISGASEDPELEYMKALYRPHFKAAFREALGELEPKERALLKQSLLDGLSIDALAGLHQVHRATAARWVAAARERLIGATRARFQAKVRVSARECESIFRALGSQLDITLRRLGDAV